MNAKFPLAPSCLSILIDAVRSMRSRTLGELKVSYNDLAGYLGGDPLLDWSQSATGDRSIAVRSIVFDQTKIAVTGPGDYILQVGVPFGVVQVGGHGARKWVILNSGFEPVPCPIDVEPSRQWRPELASPSEIRNRPR